MESANLHPNLGTDRDKVNNLDTCIDAKTLYKPFVRFAISDGSQRPKLRGVSESIPENANFASPIYYLQESETKQQTERENPYAVKNETCIANRLQEICETERREYYPIYVESDAEVPLDEQVEWIWEFCRDELDIDPCNCTWYYSGGGSIHLHTPKLARQRDLQVLKELAKEFEYDLDSKVYERKRQFRLPGAIHQEKQLPKVEIDPEWGHDRIFREAATSDVSRPESFKEVLTNTFGPNVLKRPDDYLWTPTVDPEDTSQSIDPGVNLWEYHSPRMDLANHAIWKSHYSHPVSPYANAVEGDRSLLVAKVTDGPFSEKRETHYGGDNPEIPEKREHIIVPCQIFSFWSCDRQYQIDRGEYRPVRLSKTDYQKFASSGIGEGDFFTLIGGNSGKSIIHTPTVTESRAIGTSNSISEAIELLKAFEYDAGEAGLHDFNRVESTSKQEREETCASKLQKQAEEEGIDSLSHRERTLVMLRQLAIGGIKKTRNWFEEQYGDNYDPDLTNRFIRQACENYEDTPQYKSVNVTRRSI